MNSKTTFGALCFCLFCYQLAWAQPDYTANDQIPPYTQAFRYGSNFGNYPPWSNNQVADIAAGQQGMDNVGIGLKAHRPAMPEYFFEAWNYDIRLADFVHFDQLGIKENVAFIGFPSEAHREEVFHCNTGQSEVFSNLYEPIWDNGANGTPVNDDNYYALYIYKVITRYKHYVRFWEVWNEPDFSTNEVTWAPPGTAGNWWENNPDPCDNAFKAPIFHYIRMLRISYEVIKSVDPTAYVCTGGIGNPAFLDVILRNTDNPNNGSVAANFPLKGGAYFDVLSYHAYPHIDGSMLEWVNGTGLVWHRHSDRGVEGLIARKEAFQNVLDQYGYDGNEFPEKLWIVSETNLPRKVYQQYIGTVESQRNYMIKAFVEAQKNEILQVDVFTISELENEGNAWNEYQLMGLFENLSDYSYPDHQVTDAGIAFKTSSNLLFGRPYDPSKTAAMQLPEGIKGAAFQNPDEGHTFVLWAATSLDNSEAASAVYSFPNSFNLDKVSVAQWNYGATKDTVMISATNISLNGTPVFISEEFEEGQAVAVDDILPKEELSITVFPNPFKETVQLSLELAKSQELAISLFSSKGAEVADLLKPHFLNSGNHTFSFALKNLPKGVYWLKVQTENGIRTKKIISY